MERPPPVGRFATAIAVSGLAGAAAVHAAWAAGSTWPAGSSDELADLVVGRRPMPGPAACLTVVALLGGAAGSAVVARTDAAADHPLGRVARGATTIATAALGLRGVVGLVTSAVGVGRNSDQYRRWDLRLYSPLCLVLAGALAVGRASRAA